MQKIFKQDVETLEQRVQKIKSDLVIQDQTITDAKADIVRRMALGANPDTNLVTNAINQRAVTAESLEALEGEYTRQVEALAVFEKASLAAGKRIEVLEKAQAKNYGALVSAYWQAWQAALSMCPIQSEAGELSDNFNLALSLAGRGHSTLVEAERLLFFLENECPRLFGGDVPPRAERFKIAFERGFAPEGELVQ